MSAENKAVARRLLEEFYGQGKLDLAEQLVAASYIDHDPTSPDLRGPEGIKQFAAMYRSAFPDLRFTIEDQVAEGDRVVTRWTASGTHKGALQGIPPTGKRATVTGISFDHIVGGKIQESWSNWDALGLMQQLGAVPAMA